MDQVDAYRYGNIGRTSRHLGDLFHRRSISGFAPIPTPGVAPVRTTAAHFLHQQHHLLRQI